MKHNAQAILSIVLFAALFFSCSDSFLEDQPDQEVIDNTPQLNIEQVNQDFSNLPFKTGINDFEIGVLFNKRWRFRLIIPELAENETAPLFVSLHGGALTPRPDGFQRGDCLLRPALEMENTKAYILKPTSESLLWFHEINEAQVVNLTNFAIEHLNVDPKKVVAFGYSDGGFGSWFFADTHRELFSAAIPMAQAYGLIASDGGIIKKTEVPLYVIHGEVDELFPFTNTETLVEQSRDAGSEITLVKAIGLDYNQACSYLPYVQNALEWLQTSVWE